MGEEDPIRQARPRMTLRGMSAGAIRNREQSWPRPCGSSMLCLGTTRLKVGNDETLNFCRTRLTRRGFVIPSSMNVRYSRLVRMCLNILNDSMGFDIMNLGIAKVNDR
jgi:hypothetical protein